MRFSVSGYRSEAHYTRLLQWGSVCLGTAVRLIIHAYCSETQCVWVPQWGSVYTNTAVTLRVSRYCKGTRCKRVPYWGSTYTNIAVRSMCLDKVARLSVCEYCSEAQCVSGYYKEVRWKRITQWRSVCLDTVASLSVHNTVARPYAQIPYEAK